MGIVVPYNLHNLMVKDLVDTNGEWRTDLLASWLPQTVTAKLYAMLPPHGDGDIDIRAWCGTSDGSFTIASAYNVICKFNDENWEKEWLSIWQLTVPERVRSFIWNREAHGDTRIRSIHPWSFILGWVLQYERADVSNIVSSSTQKIQVNIAWNGTEEGCFIQNTDGACRASNVAGCGGLIRNSSGQWIGGFSMYLGRCNAYLVELWGVLEGLHLAREKGVTKMEVRVDSKVVVQTLNNTKGGSVIGWTLLK
ncbi:ribonuclease H protein [Trifolium medium]|uniref:Ribonuclease H protein n=1 Tax=Trifolium medium TaxID=97028 RepID=A0A392MDA4_9FABA|nr:ribonuclease H protein [Trifolium medium]